MPTTIPTVGATVNFYLNEAASAMTATITVVHPVYVFDPSNPADETEVAPVGPGNPCDLDAVDNNGAHSTWLALIAQDSPQPFPHFRWP